MDMKTYLHKSVSLVMALVVFISTAGFTVYEHHCSCTDTVTTMLFSDVTDCCHHEAPACCEHQDMSCSMLGNDMAHDCCSSSLSYFKINIPVELPVQAKSLAPYPKLFMVQETALDDPILAEDTEGHEPGHAAPSRQIGSSLVIFLHQLKIAPPSA